MEIEKLSQFVLALVGREDVGCASGTGGGTVDDKVGEGDEKYARESSPQPGRRMFQTHSFNNRNGGKHQPTNIVIKYNITSVVAKYGKAQYYLQIYFRAITVGGITNCWCKTFV